MGHSNGTRHLTYTFRILASHVYNHRFLPNFVHSASLIAAPVCIRKFFHFRHEAISWPDCQSFTAGFPPDHRERNERGRTFFPPSWSHHNCDRKLCLRRIPSLGYCDHIEFASFVNFEIFAPQVCAVRVTSRPSSWWRRGGRCGWRIRHSFGASRKFQRNCFHGSSYVV